MKLGRREFLSLAGGAVAAPAVARVAWGQAPQVTLKLHHFLPPVSNGHRQAAGALGQEGRGRFRRPHQDRHLPLDAARRHAAAALRSGARRRRRHRLDLARLHARPLPDASRCSSCRSSPTSARVPNARAVQEFAEANLRDGVRARSIRSASGRTTTGSSTPTSRSRRMEDMKGLQAALADAAGRRGAEGARRHRHRPMPIPQVPEALAQRRSTAAWCRGRSCRPSRCTSW